MLRRTVPAAAVAAIVCAALWALKVKAEPETVDVRAVVPGSAWVYVEAGPGSTADWKEYLFGGLPEEEKKEAIRKMDELWNDFAKTASEQIGTDLGTFLKEVDRVHFALLDVEIVPVVRNLGPGPGWETERPEFEILIAVKSKSKGYFGGLMEGDFKKYLQPGPDYRNRKTWVIDTPAGEMDRDLKSFNAVHLVAAGDTVFASNVRSTIEKAIDALDGAAVPGGPISANPDFQKAVKLAGKDSILVGFVNLRVLFAGLEETLDRDGLEVYQKIDAAAGQSLLRSGVLFAGLDGRYSYSGGSLHIDSGHELWSILRQEPAKKDLLAVVPAEAVAATVFTVTDAAATWAKLRKYIEEKVKLLADENDKDDFERGLAQTEEGLGTSIDDILAVIGDEIGWAMVLPEDPGLDPRSQVILVELKDVEKAKVVIDDILSSEIFRGEMKGEMKGEEYKGVTLYSLEGGELPVGYGILDKSLVVTFDPGVMRKIVDAWKAGATIETDKEYKAAMKRLPAENSKLFYYNAGAVARLALAEAADPEMAEMLKGSQGVAFVTVEKAEEASFLAGCELNSAYYAEIVKNALPMLEEQRDRSIRTQCMSNLRGIGMSATAWVELKGGGKDYPMTLADLTDAQLLDGRGIKCPNPRGPMGQYEYYHPPKGFGTGMEFILAHDTDSHPDGTRAVLFFSGRVDALPEEELTKMLEAQWKLVAEDGAAALEDAEDALKSAAGDAKAGLEKKVEFLKKYVERAKAGGK
jgi:hypothetical protein